MCSCEYTTGQAIWEWRQTALREALHCGISPYEVDWLIQEIAGLDILSLRLDYYKNRTDIELKYPLKKLERLWQARLTENLPLQYITQSAYWRDLVLKVTPAVLIPRPETEFLVDLVKTIAEKEFFLSEGNWVDLGTGSGAISIGLARTLENIKIYAVDLSQNALDVAQENIKKYNLAQRIFLQQGSWWDPLGFLRGKVSGMISNPPYIPSSLIAQLDSNVKDHEPHLALDGGEDGLQAIKYLVTSSSQYLISGGVWLIEMMIGQGELVISLLEKDGNYQKIELIKDFAGIDRYVLARKI